MPPCEGPPRGSAYSFDSAAWRRALNLSLADGALSTTLTTLTTGVFLTGFALALGANQLQIGILAALPTLANVAQLAGSYVIERTRQRKTLCLVSTTVARSLWFLILALPILTSGISRYALVWWMILLLAMSSALSAVGGVAWLCWMRDFIPYEHRADFLSRRNQVGTALSLSLSILAGVFLDWWDMHWSESVLGFAMVFGFAGLCGVAAVPFLRATPDAPMPEESTRPAFSKLLALPFRDVNFRRLVLFYALWNLGVNLAGPFFNVYMIRDLQLPFWYVTLVTTLAGVASLASNRFWVRLSEQFGYKPIVFLATLGNAFFPLCWIFIDANSAWLLIPVHLLGIFNSVLNLGPNNIMFKLAPDRNASAYLAMFNAVVGPATAAAPVLGGLIAPFFASVQWSLGPFTLAGIKFLFLFSFVARLGSLALLHRVTEPESDSVRYVVRMLSRVRFSKPSEGLQTTLSLVTYPRRVPARLPAPHFSSANLAAALDTKAKETRAKVARKRKLRSPAVAR